MHLSAIIDFVPSSQSSGDTEAESCMYISDGFVWI